MTATLMRNLAPVALVALASLLLAPVADAKPKGKPACSAAYFPFYKGQVFEYEWLAPEAVVAEGQDPVVTRGPKAAWPTDLKIEVKAIKGGAKTATITLVETYRKRSVETTITCNETGFKVSPQSFFFAGEPGGGIGMELTDFKQDQVGIPGPALVKQRPPPWTSFIKAKVTRTKTEGSTTTIVTNGKIEIDREMAIGPREAVETGLGERRGFRLDVSLAGRAAVEPAMDKWRELPPARVTMWFSTGMGMVRVHNRYGHGWQIKSVTFPE